MVREFDANLMTENEMRKHFSQVGSVDRISIITRGRLGAATTPLWIFSQSRLRTVQ